MQIIDKKGLLVRTKNPDKITSYIQKSRVVGSPAEGMYDVLVYFNMVNARILQNLGFKKTPAPIEVDYGWPGMYKPFDHQKETASFLTLHRRAFCLNEQGTGKTGSAIWAADYLMKLGKIKRALIICPLSIMDSAWRADLFNFAMHRTVDIAHSSGTKAAQRRKEIINGEAEFVIINYDGLNIVEEEIKKAGFDLIIVDEANAYKNAQTTRWKTLNKIGRAHV